MTGHLIVVYFMVMLGVCIGEASNPGPFPENFWSPLLSGRVEAATLRQRYIPAVRDFVTFVEEDGELVDSADECE